MRRFARYLGAAALLVGAAACGDDEVIPGQPDAGPGGADAQPSADANEGGVPSTYTFPSRFGEGSSVAYNGQALRQVLIADLASYISGLTAQIDGGSTPTEGQIVSALNFYYDYGDDGAEVPIRLSTGSGGPPTLQTAYGEIGNAKLSNKIAGKDPAYMWTDWEAGIVGWTGSPSPHDLVQSWFGELEALAIARAGVDQPQGPYGAAIKKVHVTPEGRDLQQLVQKFLLVAVAYSQATDDYWDEGLDASNLQDGDKPYSVLEHYWDEGFGYFGAARDFGSRTDEELAATAYHDTDGDGTIDLTSEWSYSLATYAAKRDLGSATSAKTDFTKEIFDAVVMGRYIIWSAEGELDDTQKAAVAEQRDRAVAAWDKVLAANVVHYLNRTVAMMKSADFTDEDAYDFEEHAKLWSEMKAFALGLQFNPRSPILDDFAQLHTYLGDAPVLPTAGATAINQYVSDLLAARGLLKDAYGFADANIGDADGANGW